MNVSLLGNGQCNNKYFFSVITYRERWPGSPVQNIYSLRLPTPRKLSLSCCLIHRDEFMISTSAFVPKWKEFEFGSLHSTFRVYNHCPIIKSKSFLFLRFHKIIESLYLSYDLQHLLFI